VSSIGPSAGVVRRRQPKLRSFEKRRTFFPSFGEVIVQKRRVFR